MKTYITTWLKVLNEVPNFFNFETGEFQNVNKGKILEFIGLEESMIRTRLKPYYGVNLSNGVSHILTTILKENRDKEFVFPISGITFTNQSTQVYKIEFDTDEDFTIKTDFDGAFSGSILADCVMTDITIKTNAWQGYEFAAGDIIYLNTFYHELPLIDIATKSAAAKLIENVFISEAPDTSGNARLLRDQVKEFFTIVRSEVEENPLQISKVYRNIDPISSGYTIDYLGEDQTDYADV